MSSFDLIRSGSVIAYPYLWEREALSGETSGRKSRPSAVVIRKPSANGDILALLAITSKAPAGGQTAIEIPEAEKRRAGLDGDLRLWIVLDEYNVDVVGSSFYLEPQKPIGSFSRAFFLPVFERFVHELPKRKAIKRT
jgi:hypothetical protein